MIYDCCKSVKLSPWKLLFSLTCPLPPTTIFSFVTLTFRSNNNNNPSRVQSLSAKPEIITAVIWAPKTNIIILPIITHLTEPSCSWCTVVGSEQKLKTQRFTVTSQELRLLIGTGTEKMPDLKIIKYQPTVTISIGNAGSSFVCQAGFICLEEHLVKGLHSNNLCVFRPGLDLIIINITRYSINFYHPLLASPQWIVKGLTACLNRYFSDSRRLNQNPSNWYHTVLVAKQS